MIMNKGIQVERFVVGKHLADKIVRPMVLQRKSAIAEVPVIESAILEQYKIIEKSCDPPTLTEMDGIPLVIPGKLI